MKAQVGGLTEHAVMANLFVAIRAEAQPLLHHLLNRSTVDCSEHFGDELDIVQGLPSFLLLLEGLPTRAKTNT